MTNWTIRILYDFTALSSETEFTWPIVVTTTVWLLLYVSCWLLCDSAIATRYQAGTLWVICSRSSRSRLSTLSTTPSGPTRPTLIKSTQIIAEKWCWFYRGWNRLMRHTADEMYSIDWRLTFCRREWRLMTAQSWLSSAYNASSDKLTKIPNIYLYCILTSDNTLMYHYLLQ